MNPSLHAFVEVPFELTLSDQAIFIGRLVSIYRGSHEPECIHMGRECYKVATLGQWESQMERRLLEDLDFQGKLFIVFSEAEHATPVWRMPLLADSVAA